MNARNVRSITAILIIVSIMLLVVAVVTSEHAPSTFVNEPDYHVLTANVNGREISRVVVHRGQPLSSLPERVKTRSNVWFTRGGLVFTWPDNDTIGEKTGNAMVWREGSKWYATLIGVPLETSFTGYGEEVFASNAVPVVLVDGPQ